MQNKLTYDACIIGGGLAGLSLSILLAKANLKVLIIEKKSYPKHKVCGEYISLESWNFLTDLGVPLQKMQLPIIKKLQLTSTDSKQLNTDLPLGGFGISRFILDEYLYKLALQNGVEVSIENTFNGYTKYENNFDIQTSKGNYAATFLFAAIGKYSSKSFCNTAANKNEYVGVKYHLKSNNAKNEIALHAFEGGYAGISAIENNTFCFCYLVQASILKKFNGNILEMQNQWMAKNNFIKNILDESTFVWSKPEVISNIYFGVKKMVYDDVIFLGDSAGAIPPLCGNGMSMALRSAALLAPLVVDCFHKKNTVANLQTEYAASWNKHFSKRIRVGIWFQKLFFVPHFFSVSIRLLNVMRFLQKPLIRLTHGKSF